MLSTCLLLSLVSKEVVPFWHGHKSHQMVLSNDLIESLSNNEGYDR